MKKIIAFLALCTVARAVGTVQTNIQTLSTDVLGRPTSVSLSFYWTGDSSTGAVPSTNATGLNCCIGFYVVQVETIPGTPSPTFGYGLTVTDSAGVDVLGGAASSLSNVASASFAASTSAPPVQGQLTMNISGQAVASAKGTVYVFLVRPGTVTSAALQRLQSGQASVTLATPTGFPTTGLLGYYRMVDATGTTVPDTSGNGNNGTLVNSPTVSSLGITFTRGSTQYITLPSGVFNNAKTVMLCADFSTNQDGNNYAAYWGSATNNLATFFINTSNTTSASFFDNPATVINGSVVNMNINQGLPPQGCITVVTTNGANDRIFLDGVEDTYNAATSGSSFANMHVDELFGDQSNNPTIKSFTGIGYFAALWSTSLTPAQVAQARNTVWNSDITLRRNWTPFQNTSTTSTLICYGDSRFTSAGSGTSTCQSLVWNLTDTYNFFNVTQSGLTARGMAQGVNQLAVFRAPLARHPCTVITDLGGNDLSTSGVVSQTEDAIREAVLAIKGQGCQVILTDIESANVGLATDALIQQVNAWERGNWASFADGFVDPASDTRFGATGASTNPVYFNQASPPHQNITGQNIEVRQFFSDAVNKLNGATNTSCQRFQLRYTNPAFEVASTTATVQMFLLPQFAKINSCWVKHSTQFVGAAAASPPSSMTVSMGSTAGTATSFAAAQQVLSTAVSGTAFTECTNVGHSVTMGAADAINLYVTTVNNMGKASQSITAATNANPPVYTATAHGMSTGNVIQITGFTGASWVNENSGGVATIDAEFCVVNVITVNTFSCSSGAGSIDSTTFGAIAGTPVFTTAFLTAGEVDAGLCYQMVQ